MSTLYEYWQRQIGENHGHNQYQWQRKATVDDTSAAPPPDLTATEDLLCEVAAAEPRRPGAGAEVEVLLFRGLD